MFFLEWTSARVPLRPPQPRDVRGRPPGRTAPRPGHRRVPGQRQVWPGELHGGVEVRHDHGEWDNALEERGCVSRECVFDLNLLRADRIYS